MIIKHAQVFTGQDFQERTVYIKDGRFADALEEEGQEVLDAQGSYLIPGLIDLHFHGCMGYDFCDGTQEALSAIADYQASRGVTAICPATMTYPEDKLAHIMENAAAFAPAAHESELVGINMEGPFISCHKIGAQNPKWVQRCDKAMYKRLQEKSQDLIKLVDVAPEEPEALDFIDEVSQSARISIAHTCASYDEACTAIEHGARHVTHLYNAMPGLHHRNPGPIPAAVEADEVTPELICDGIHVHPAMARLAFRMFGDDRVILVSDSMMAAGLSDGDYELGGQAVHVENKRATLVDGTIAGSATDLMACLVHAVMSMDIPLASAVKAATKNPAQALGIYEERGSIESGKVADCVLLSSDLSLEKVIVRGLERA